jgi:hypothetical protein
MLKYNGMQKKEYDVFFEQWAKKLGEDLPDFWNNMIE